VVQVLKAGADRGEVDALRVALDAAGVRTSVAYMTPTRVVMKSTASPEHALEPPPALAAAPEAAAEAVAPKVVIVDTGVASRERDDGWLGGLQTDANKDLLDVFPRPNGYLDLSAGHGTFVAGLFQQADPGLDLQVIKALDTDGFAHEVDVACAIVRSVEEHLRPGGKLVLNLSLGADTVDDLPPLALEAALQIVRELESARGGEVLLVAAAGNDGASTRCWPAAFAEDDDRVVAVAALTAAGAPAPWSTRAEWVTCAAVGEAVMSTYVTGREDPDLDADPEVFGKNAWAYWTGTSFAAPQVGAAVASLARRTGMSLSDALRQVLASGSGTDPLYGSLLPALPH
jgi:subtilisin family serine protease